MYSLKFSKTDFDRLDLPDIILNIHSYMFGRCPECKTCKTYLTSNVEIARALWRPEFKDFNQIMNPIKKDELELERISSEEKHFIYHLIM